MDDLFDVLSKDVGSNINTIDTDNLLLALEYTISYFETDENILNRKETNNTRFAQIFELHLKILEYAFVKRNANLFREYFAKLQDFLTIRNLTLDNIPFNDEFSKSHYNIFKAFFENPAYFSDALPLDSENLPSSDPFQFLNTLMLAYDIAQRSHQQNPTNIEYNNKLFWIVCVVMEQTLKYSKSLDNKLTEINNITQINMLNIFHLSNVRCLELSLQKNHICQYYKLIGHLVLITYYESCTQSEKALSLCENAINIVVDADMPILKEWSDYLKDKSNELTFATLQTEFISFSSNAFTHYRTSTNSETNNSTTDPKQPANTGIASAILKLPAATTYDRMRFG